jgi:hypothetical protein
MPWHNVTLPCNEVDWALFHASTEISLENRDNALFWQDKGRCLRTLPIACLKLPILKKELLQRISQITTRSGVFATVHVSSAFQWERQRETIPLPSPLSQPFDQKWMNQIVYYSIW